MFTLYVFLPYSPWNAPCGSHGGRGVSAVVSSVVCTQVRLGDMETVVPSLLACRRIEEKRCSAVQPSRWASLRCELPEPQPIVVPQNLSPLVFGNRVFYSSFALAAPTQPCVLLRNGAVSRRPCCSSFPLDGHFQCRGCPNSLVNRSFRHRPGCTNCALSCRCPRLVFPPSLHFGLHLLLFCGFWFFRTDFFFYDNELRAMCNRFTIETHVTSRFVMLSLGEKAFLSVFRIAALRVPSDLNSWFSRDAIRCYKEANSENSEFTVMPGRRYCTVLVVVFFCKVFVYHWCRSRKWLQSKRARWRCTEAWWPADPCITIHGKRVWRRLWIIFLWNWKNTIVRWKTIKYKLLYLWPTE